MSAPGTGDAIFVHGILPRSGTNFLWDLLLLHPDCARGRQPVNEDLFLDHSDDLDAFVRSVRGAWDPNWGTFPAGIADELRSAIGEGLTGFLWTDRTRRLVTKSPSVRNLHRFFAMFPGAKLLILVRDGRSVVQSAMDTFGWDFDRGCRAWADAAAIIRRFQTAEADRADRWRVVRYEDLVDDTEGQLRQILAFLDLDAARYDFEAARNLPVRGSSAFGRDGGRVHWNEVARDPSFAPKERWRSWSPARLERFDWIAGEQLCAFGYVASRSRIPAARALQHRLRDWRWRGAQAVRVATYRARVRLALRTRLRATVRQMRGQTGQADHR